MIRKQIPAELKALIERDMRFTEMMHHGKFAEAVIMREVREELRKKGWPYPSASFHLSIACYQLGRYDECLELNLEALAQDPLNREYGQSVAAVARRMRQVIEDPRLAVEDLRIPRYHALLVRQGEATVETHLALLQHLAAVGNEKEVARISEALSLLYPSHPEVWRYRAVVDAEIVDEPKRLTAPLAAIALLPAPTAKA